MDGTIGGGTIGGGTIGDGMLGITDTTIHISLTTPTADTPTTPVDVGITTTEEAPSYIETAEAQPREALETTTTMAAALQEAAAEATAP